MSNLYVAYAFVGLMVLACVILAVVNWISLVSLSSKSAYLEEEIQKKALEFAAIKKEIQNQGRLAMESAVDQAPSSEADSGRIDVVRSVRQGVDNPEVQLTQETIDFNHHGASSAHQSETPLSVAVPAPDLLQARGMGTAPEKEEPL